MYILLPLRPVMESVFATTVSCKQSSERRGWI